MSNQNGNAIQLSPGGVYLVRLAGGQGFLEVRLIDVTDGVARFVRYLDPKPIVQLLPISVFALSVAGDATVTSQVRDAVKKIRASDRERHPTLSTSDNVSRVDQASAWLRDNLNDVEESIDALHVGAGFPRDVSMVLEAARLACAEMRARILGGEK